MDPKLKRLMADIDLSCITDANTRMAVQKLFEYLHEQAASGKPGSRPSPKDPAQSLPSFQDAIKMEHITETKTQQAVEQLLNMYTSLR